jgi:hypothetical protein
VTFAFWTLDAAIVWEHIFGFAEFFAESLIVEQLLFVLDFNVVVFFYRLLFLFKILVCDKVIEVCP